MNNPDNEIILSDNADKDLNKVHDHPLVEDQVSDNDPNLYHTQEPVTNNLNTSFNR